MNKSITVSAMKNILILLILISPLALLIIANPNDWFGIIFIFITFLFILLQPVFKSNKGTFISIIFVFFAKIFIALINSNFITIYGAGADAKGFLRRATIIIQNNIDISLLNVGADLFENYLALVFSFIGISQFSAEILSISIFILATSYLLKISNLIYGSKYNMYLVLLFGLPPSMLIYTSIIMREPYQILFFLMSIYYFLKIINGKRIEYILFLKFFLTTFIMGVLHNGLLLFTFIIWLVFLFIILKNNFKITSFLVRLTISVISLFVLVNILNVLGISTQATTALLEGDISSYVEQYRDGGMRLDSRAQYGTELDTSNVFTILLTIPFVFINYMLAPFPWQITSVIDIYALFEAVIRFLLIVLAFKFYKETKEKNTINIFVQQILFLFFLMEILWSMGTVNWGTAIRHHLIAYGLILILAVPKLIDIIKR